MLYNTYMTTISVSEARESFSSLIEDALEEAIILQRYGKPVVVVLGYEQYEELMEVYENSQDLDAIAESLKTPAKNIPWKRSKRSRAQLIIWVIIKLN